MTKVMVFNQKFEQASKDEGNDLLSLIDAMNSDCAAQHRVQTDADWSCKKCGFENHGSWSECGECQTPRS